MSLHSRYIHLLPLLHICPDTSACYLSTCSVLGRRLDSPSYNTVTNSHDQKRRTQIRLAQRAYRNRKETTIEDLRKRVSGLQSTVEVMNKTICDFSDVTSLTLDISPSLLASLHSLRQRFGTLATAARQPGEAAEDASSNLMKNLSAIAIDPAVLHVSSSSERSSAPIHDDSSDNFDAVPIGMGYSLLLDTSEQTSNDQNRDSALSQALVTAETTRPSYSLRPPTSFSILETSFARRLHRRSLEAGWMLLNDPTRSPEVFERVFRLSFNSGRDRHDLIDRFQELLKRGIGEPLDMWWSSHDHVGGAGTHFPKQREHIYGARAAWQAEEDGRYFDMSTSRASGSEGEWFDANDVEGYLADRGIVIHPQSTYVTVELPTSALEAITLDATPPTPVQDIPRIRDIGETEDLQDVSMPSIEDFDFGTLDFTNVGFSDAETGSSLNFLPPTTTDSNYDKYDVNNSQYKMSLGGTMMDTLAPPPPFSTLTPNSSVYNPGSSTSAAAYTSFTSGPTSTSDIPFDIDPSDGFLFPAPTEQETVYPNAPMAKTTLTLDVQKMIRGTCLPSCRSF